MSGNCFHVEIPYLNMTYRGNSTGRYALYLVWYSSSIGCEPRTPYLEACYKYRYDRTSRSLVYSTRVAGRWGKAFLSTRIRTLLYASLWVSADTIGWNSGKRWHTWHDKLTLKYAQNVELHVRTASSHCIERIPEAVWYHTPMLLENSLLLVPGSSNALAVLVVKYL